jgi:hypothetical protein
MAKLPVQFELVYELFQSFPLIAHERKVGQKFLGQTIFFQFRDNSRVQVNIRGSRF